MAGYLLERMLRRVLQLDRRMRWRMSAHAPVVHLTFDDGPMEGLTPWVLDTLAAFNAKATFFCIGRNIAAHPAIFQRIIDEGHAVGNHTWDHCNGWTTPMEAYMTSVKACQELTGTDLFRPPYGRITRAQLRQLRPLRPVMWDVLSNDFREGITGEQCAQRVMALARPGSIIVFHDNAKSEERLRVALPEVLKRLRAKGITSQALPSSPLAEIGTIR